MKKITMIMCLAILLLGGCAGQKNAADIADTGDDEFHERIPLVNGYYNGEMVWFIHPDVSSAEAAEKLTRMIDYKTIYVPQHNEAVDAGKLAKLYLFTNGIDHKDEKPWGGGPFGYQIDIFDSVPGDEGYTSLRRPHLVTWVQDARPRILKSEETVLAAEQAGELTIEEAEFVVNVPMVRWPGASTRIDR